MTKKSKAKKEVPAKKEDKQVLYELVQENPTPNYVIMGALSKAGLLSQYRQEESIYKIEDIEPSITKDELDKVIKEFIGE